MSGDALKQLKQAKLELDERQLRKAQSTISALLASLSSSSVGSAKESKKQLELHYQALLLSGLIQQRLHRQAQALQAYNDATRLQPENPAAYKALYELHSATRNDDAVLALLPTLLPIMQQAAAQPKRVAFLVHAAQLLLERRKWKEARELLFPLAGLDPKAEDVLENGPVIDIRVFLPPAFYRLMFGLVLQLDEAEKGKELSVRIDRQLKKLRDKREEDKVVQQKAEARRLLQQKQRGEKLTLHQPSKEDRERQLKAERDEEEDVRRRVTSKLNGDWLKRDDNEQRLHRLHEWAEGYGMGCDDECQHAEEEAWVKRHIERMNLAGSAEEYSNLRSGVVSMCSDMACTHATSSWCRQQLAGMEMDLWTTEQAARRITLLRSIRYFPSSSILYDALALLLCGTDEDAAQMQRDAVISTIMREYPPATGFTPSLSSAHFWSRYLSLYSSFHCASSSTQLTACTQSIQSCITDLTSYHAEHPLHPLSSCHIACQLLLADVLVSSRDEKSSDDASQLYNEFVHDERATVRRYSVYGLMKAAVLRRSMDPASALIQVKLWREAGGANVNTVAWLSAYIHFTRYTDELLTRRETTRYMTRRQRVERKGKDCVLLQQLLKALSNAQPSFPVLLLKGKIMWALGGDYRTDKQFAYEAFVGALSHYSSSSWSQSPFSLSSSLLSHSDCFAYLGLYTQHVLQLPLKAQLFYQKALQIQPHNPTAGPALSLLLSAASQDSQLLSLYTSAIHSDSRCRWAYLLSARYHVQHAQAQQGIALYQHALRSEGKGGGSVWSELGASYFQVGSFIAALRCWKKGVEINPEDDGGKYGMAQVLIMLSMHREAIDLLSSMLSDYEAIPKDQDTDGQVDDEEDDSPQRRPPVIAVTRLLADAYFAEAVAQCSAGAYAAALASVSSCIQTAQSCLPLVTESSSPAQLGGTYKALGDAHALYAQLPVDSSADLIERSANSQPLQQQKLRLLQLADRFYAKAIHLAPTLASLWYDRASVIRQLMLVVQQASVSTAGEEQLHRSRAIACFKRAVSLAPYNAFHWLGLASVLPSFASRHHALVQSLKLQKSATGWAHLSLFYLQHGGGAVSSSLHTSPQLPSSFQLTSIGEGSQYSHLDAARLSLQLAQTVDPMHPAVWLAQGLFNSNFNEANVLASAAGCFGRSVELGPTYEARVGLVWCSVMVQDWLTACYDARKLVEQWPERSAGWNLYGACCEWQGRMAEAEQAYSTAEQLMATESLLLRTTSSADAPAIEERTRQLLLRIIQVNRVRVLSALTRYADSILLAQSIMQRDVELSLPSSSSSSLYLYHLLSEVYAKGGQYEEGRKVVVAAMELISQAREETGEEDESLVHVRQLADEYHRFFVEFVQLLLYEGKDDEALHHLGDKIQQQDEAADDAEHDQRRLELLRLMLSVGDKKKDASILHYTLLLMKQSTDRLLDILPSSQHAALLVALHESSATAALAQGDLQAAKRSFVKAVAVDLTNMSTWNALLDFHLQHIAAWTSTVLPLLTVPRLHELQCQHDSSIIARLRLLAQAYVLSNRFLPATPSLSQAYEQEEQQRRAAEETQLTASHAADEAAEDDAAEDDSTVVADDVQDDDVRHELPVDRGLAQLVAAESSSFTFDQSIAPPSSRHAVSAAARLVLLDPTATAHWGLLAAAAEGREQERKRRALDSDEGWNSVVSSSGHHYGLLQQRSFSHLPPPELAVAQSNTVTSSLSALLLTMYAMSQLSAESGKSERLAHLQQSVASIPTDRLTSLPLRWQFHRCSARIALVQGDVKAALCEYQRCIELTTSAAAEANGSTRSVHVGPSPPPCSAVIWEEIAHALEPGPGAALALKTGLQLLDERSSTQLTGDRSRDAERLSLVLALLQRYDREDEHDAGLTFLRAELPFLSSQPSSSPLLLSLLQCEWLDMAGRRAEWKKEATILAGLWQQWENEASTRAGGRWEEPPPPRVHWHIAQLNLA